MGLPVVAPVKGLVLSRASWITRMSLLRKQQLDHCCREMQTQGWAMFDSLAVVAQQKKKKKNLKAPYIHIGFVVVFS